MALITVGTDLSTRSDRALRRAVLLALAHSLELVLVLVLDDEPNGSITDEPERNAERIKEACRTISKMEGVACRADIRSGEVAEQLTSAAAADHATLILIGPYRQSVMREALTSITAERIIARSDRPVIMANALAAGPYRRVLVAIDPKHPSPLHADFIQSLPIAHAAEWLLVHVYDAEAREMLGRSLPPPGMKQQYLVERSKQAHAELASSAIAMGWDQARQIVRENLTSVEGDILETARSENADLLVIAKSNKSPLERALLGSVTRALLRQHDVDVLVMP